MPSRKMPGTEPLRRAARALLTSLLAVVALAAAGPLAAQMAALEDLDSFPRAKLEITGGGKSLEFDIWVADTPQRMAQGLMFVRSLPPQRGMLFVHDSPRTLSMWMKNTYIPLDMVFIDARGRIQQIVAQTTPHSLDTIRSNNPALAVLEIGGGEAQRLGIKAGQRVNHPAFSKR
ncbi:MAG TPA: DUF192 domain-containing protein [Steroidobacteraceae bacterium]